MPELRNSMMLTYDAPEDAPAVFRKPTTAGLPRESVYILPTWRPTSAERCSDPLLRLHLVDMIWMTCLDDALMGARRALHVVS